MAPNVPICNEEKGVLGEATVLWFHVMKAFPSSKETVYLPILILQGTAGLILNYSA